MRRGDRLIVFIIYLFIAVLGVLLFGIGFFWLELEQEYQKAIQRLYIYVGAILMALGLMIAIITIFVWYSVTINSLRQLGKVSFLSLLLVIVYADYGLFAYQLKSASSPYMEGFGKDLEQIVNNTKTSAAFFEHLHNKFHCCIKGVHHFQRTKKYVVCCESPNSTCIVPGYKKECFQMFKDYISNNFQLTGTIATVIALLNFFIFGFIRLRKRRMTQRASQTISLQSYMHND